jgi:hypothetical protein
MSDRRLFAAGLTARTRKSESMISPSGKRLGSLVLSVFGMALFSSHAQTVAKPPVKTPATGGNSFPGPNAIRYEDGTDQEDRLIDKFMGDWHDSMPRHEHGSLVLRDILTHGNNLNPPQPGAVLQATNLFPMAACNRVM